MPAINLTDRVLAVQYDGTNSAEIDGLITDFTIDSEAGGVLMFTSGGNPFVANTGNWVRYTQGFVLNTHTTASLDTLFIRNAVYTDLPDTAAIEADIDALQDAVEALEASGGGLLSAGVKECPLLIVGNTTVAVDIIPAMPDTSYTPHAELFASVALLGVLTIGSITVVDANTVNVVVNNGGLISVTGANVLVTVTA